MGFLGFESRVEKKSRLSKLDLLNIQKQEETKRGISDLRDIKFRGILAKNKYKKDNEKIWVYGSLIHGANLYITPIREDDTCSINVVIPETIGQYTEIKDINDKEIYEKMTVHQYSVLIGSPEIDFVGEVKFYDGTWYIDNGTDSVELFNEACENKIVEDA